MSLRQAPLATPETLSETSSCPPSPMPPIRPMRRTPKISGNLSTAADDLKNNLHFAMLSAKNCYLREEMAGRNSQGSSSGHSDASYPSYESTPRNFTGASLPPPLPRRDESSNILQRFFTNVDIIYLNQFTIQILIFNYNLQRLPSVYSSLLSR